MKYLAFILTLAIAAGPNGFCQEPEIDPSQLPRIPAMEPEDALKSFELRPGFQLKLAVHEPDVADPIEMAFDADGGMYVLEMRGYSERREEALGRVRYLEDKDGDGTFESSTIFKDHLKWPTGLVCYKGGVFVGASPDLFYFKDTDGDRVSDEEHLVFTGFGHNEPRLNMQALFNSFRWGPDNRIWGATAANGGNVIKLDDPSFGPVSIRGADFSFDPEKLDFRVENGTAQYGMSFDSLGQRFVCSNSRHALWVAYERDQVRQNPYYDLPRAIVDIPDDGGAAPVFRISADEPWRVVRTRWRVSGVVKGMIEGGGRVSGYFTSASGIHVYWGGAFGDEFQNNLFVGDVGSNLVHRKIVRKVDGNSQPSATRPRDEHETEFLRSSDNWFRPVSFATGPDGCLYICDMYREIIEHPWSLPPGIKKHLDLNSGYDRGRIYRVEPEGFRRQPISKLSQASDAELLTLVNQGQGDWQQTTARRLLFERGKPLPPKPPLSPFPAKLNSEDSLIEYLPQWKGDPWLEATILNSLRDVNAISAAWTHPLIDTLPGFESELTKISGRSGNKKVIAAVAERLSKLGMSSRMVDLVKALKEGITYARGNWTEIEKLRGLSDLFDKARSTARNSNAAEKDRLTALRLLALEAGNHNQALRKSIVSDQSSSKLLITEASRDITDSYFLINHFERLPVQSRGRAVAQMIKNPEDAIQLLNSIEQGIIKIEDVPAESIQKLRNHNSMYVIRKAVQVLPKVEKRSDVIARYQPAITEPGNPKKGEVAFNKACLSCHKTHDGKGIAFGPPITSFKTAGRDSILGNILDPNKEVAPQYQAFQFTLNNGEKYLAMIASEDTRNVTLSLPGGTELTFPRPEVKSMTGVGSSLMPEGLEHTLSVEEMTDLLAYLTQDN